jgi:PadR family transcriptional regulator PadR
MRAAAAHDFLDERQGGAHTPFRYFLENLEEEVPESLPLVRGTLDALVLKALSWTPMHGFEITTWLEEQSGGDLDVNDSALYQALYRMEERGLVEAQWGVTENNRRARYYTITPEGRAYLAEEAERFLRYAQTVGGILNAMPRATGGAS